MLRIIKLGLLILIAWFLVMTIHCRGATFDEFARAINQVEASGRKTNVPAGDHGKAIGPLQIHYNYWLDSHTLGAYSSCTNYEYSVKVMRNYLVRYNRNAILSRDWETCARIHNGGPYWNYGSARRHTREYWEKVKKVLTR